MTAISDFRLPDTLAKVNLPKVDLPTVDMPKIDLGRALSDAADAAHLGGRSRRSRWPFAVAGLIVAGVAGWAIMNSQQLRSSLREIANSARERISAMRSNPYDLSSIDRDDPIAFPAAETKPIAPEPWTDGETIAAPDYPDGLGSNNDDGIPALEKSPHA